MRPIPRTALAASATPPRARVSSSPPVRSLTPSHFRTASDAADLSRCWRRVALGDEPALADLFDLLAPSLLAFASVIVSEPAEAEAVVEATFLELWSQAPDPGLTRGLTVDVWAITTTHRIARDRQRPSPLPTT